MFKTILIILPVLYLINVKIQEQLFQCGDYHGIYWVLNTGF